jgi:ribosome production factor 1
MPKQKKTSTTVNTSRTFSIPNKIHRQKQNVRIKSALSSQKRSERFERKKIENKDPTLREARLLANIPDTIERKRVWDETVPGAVADPPVEDEPSLKKLRADDEDVEEAIPEGPTPEEEAAAAEAAEEVAALAAHERAQEEAAATEETDGLFPTLQARTAPPHILLTTSRHNHTHDQVTELANLFPNTTYVPRNNTLSIKEMAKVAANPTSIDPATGKKREPYSHLIIANVDAKVVDALTVICLPAGPSYKFSMSNYLPGKRISGHGRPTSHIPELILNNFLTPLGRSTAGLFQSLFPQLPEFRGRQVVTLHNQRDYIFFRRHRYVFREKREAEKEVGYGLDGNKPGGGKGMEGLGVKVGLQELGPRFTLKLRRVQKGVQEGVVWQWQAGMEKQRTKFNL